MTAILHRADDVLRRRLAISAAKGIGRTMGQFAILIALFGMIYGAVMGASAGVFGERFWQVVYSAVKLPLLLLATFAISLPSYFVLNTLLGLRADFAVAVRALLATQAGLAIILASLAPFTAMWYASFDDYGAAVSFNGLMFAVASVSAQLVLRDYYRPLIRKHPRHRQMLRIWLAMYMFVGIQMAWVLRPFVGSPDQPVQFIREESWGNAYEAVARMLWQFVW